MTRMSYPPEVTDAYRGVSANQPDLHAVGGPRGETTARSGTSAHRERDRGTPFQIPAGTSLRAGMTEGPSSSLGTSTPPAGTARSGALEPESAGPRTPRPPAADPAGAGSPASTPASRRAGRAQCFPADDWPLIELDRQFRAIFGVTR